MTSNPIISLSAHATNTVVHVFISPRLDYCNSRVVGITDSLLWRLSWNSTGPTPTRTPKPKPTLGMRLSCNFVNVYTIAYRVQYTFTRVHARIPNGRPREDPLEEKRACLTSRRTSRRGSSCVSGSWQAERGSRRTCRHPRGDPCAEVGQDVRVGVRVGPMEFQLYRQTHDDSIHRTSITASRSKKYAGFDSRYIFKSLSQSTLRLRLFLTHQLANSCFPR